MFHVKQLPKQRSASAAKSTPVVSRETLEEGCFPRYAYVTWETIRCRPYILQNLVGSTVSYSFHYVESELSNSIWLPPTR